MDEVVFAIQKRLKEEGIEVGPVDGVWGPMTRDAVAAHLGIKRVLKPASDAVSAPWFDIARTHLGTKEAPGAANNPQVLRWYAEAGVPQQSDEVPWCAAFVGSMLKEAGYKPSGSLMARSYLEWGDELDKPRKGCIVVLKRGAPPAGHIGFVESWTAATIRVLGGNQGNSVSIASFSRSSKLSYRWPKEVLAA